MSTALVLSGGGALAVAWHCGLAAGFARAGLAIVSIDFILGTSAGAIVGAQLAAGRDPKVLADAIVAEENGLPPPGAMPRPPPAAMQKLPELFALAQNGDAERVAVGARALSTALLETEQAYVERMQSAIGLDEWPDQDIGLVAVDVADGTPRILRKDCGATVAAAVAASCCLPGLSPPVSIAGRRYMDGGLRSTANSDLARGFDAILVACFHPSGGQGDRIRSRLAAQVRALTEAGSRVGVITPDEPSLAAIGPRTLDVVRRPAVVRAGMAQGAAEAPAIARFREDLRQPPR